ncbi:MLO-like protein [Vigna angularis]|uniref:MLO-like protein n=1 Tax=Phaseolus angularis TaxID=3914 RepID=A0A8T0K9D3_PHAAN|nr:MLO-like protein [Vigna angularis]
MAEVLQQGRSLAETPTYSVASVVAVMVFVCLLVERSIYRFGEWLRKTRRKALFASLEKLKEELMLLGLISLLLAQSARWISEICVNSSLFSSRFYICSEQDLDINENIMLESSSSIPGETSIPKGLNNGAFNQCGEGHEPFVSYEGLEQLHRFLFVLGITHVLYSCLAVGLAMSKNLQDQQKCFLSILVFVFSCIDIVENPTVFVQGILDPINHFLLSIVGADGKIRLGCQAMETSKLCFLRQFRSSIRKSDYLALRLGFITLDALDLCHSVHLREHPRSEYILLAIIYPSNWAKLQHVVSTLALEIMEQRGPFPRTQVRIDTLYSQVMLHGCVFCSYFLYCSRRMHSKWQPLFGHCAIVQFWCSYMTVPLNIIVCQMGSRCKKALVAERVRESLHSWCKRVKHKSKHDSLHSHTARSVCSLESTIDERDEITVASGTLTRSSSLASLNQITVSSVDQLNFETPNKAKDSIKVAGCLSESVHTNPPQPSHNVEDRVGNGEEAKAITLLDLFQKTSLN